MAALPPQQSQKPNVLFIIVDDLRPELGCYGLDAIKTPNIDKLAGKSTIFQNAYCNIPVSGASRASLFTGMYPKFPKRFVNYTTRAQTDAPPDAVPFSQLFTNNGYHTVSNGKVFHHIDDHADSWSEPPFRTHPDGYDVYNNEYNRWEMWLNEESAKYINPKTLRGPYCESAEVPDSAYDDGKLTLKTIEDLKRLKQTNKPFFLGVGFWKPHLPFNAPKKNIGICTIAIKFLCPTIGFAPPWISPMRYKDREKYMHMQELKNRRIQYFCANYAMDIMLA